MLSVCLLQLSLLYLCNDNEMNQSVPPLDEHEKFPNHDPYDIFVSPVTVAAYHDLII